MATRAAKRAAASARRPVFSSAGPILASKITAPGVPEWAVHRPRVGALIAESTRWRPLTVLTGPPGAGKTMALAAWAAAEHRSVAWVSLEEHDNRPAAFWSYVVAALRQSGIGVPRAAQAAARARADHSLFLQLASALADQDPPVVLVLDDFHLVTEPKVLAGLDFLLRNTGAGLRLVVSSRIDPPLRLHRFRLAGELGEIRASDLAFRTAEAGHLMAQHGRTLRPDSLELLTRRTEGWAAGLRLAALSMDTHPDPDQFVSELIGENSALTGYLVEEVLNTQPPEVQDVLLSTSILDHVHPEAASAMLGNEKAARVLLEAARSNTFIQPLEPGWYRYHRVLADVLRLKLRCKQPDRVPELHRRAARWFAENGRLTEAVRHAAQAGDWELAASMVIDPLAIGEIVAPPGDDSLSSEFAGMPASEMWTTAQPYLIAAAEGLATGQAESAATALDAADGILGRLPAGQAAEARLTSAMLRVDVCRRTGDLATAASAASAAQTLLTGVPGDKLARHPEVAAVVLCGRGAVELWSGHLDEAASLLDSAAAAAEVPGAEGERAGCVGLLALAEAARGRLGRAAELAGEAAAAGSAPPAQRPPPAALVAAAWVRLEHGELREAHDRLKQADAALAARPDRLTEAIACLLVAWSALADGRARVARQFVARARDGWSPPAWLGQMLTQTESRACVAAGDVAAALTAAEAAGGDDSLEAAVARAHAWTAAGHDGKAARLLTPVLAAGDGAPERVRVQAQLLDARLSYRGGDIAGGHRRFASALRLAERQQLRLPFVLERECADQALRGDPELATRYHRLLGLAPQAARPAPPGQPADMRILVVEPLTEREREVLRHASTMLNTAEIASAMYISTNTVKTHLKSAYRKLAAGHRGEAVRRARQLQLL